MKNANLYHYRGSTSFSFIQKIISIEFLLKSDASATFAQLNINYNSQLFIVCF